jgi:hypothetical protein
MLKGYWPLPRQSIRVEDAQWLKKTFQLQKAFEQEATEENPEPGFTPQRSQRSQGNTHSITVGQSILFFSLRGTSGPSWRRSDF